MATERRTLLLLLVSLAYLLAACDGTQSSVPLAGAEIREYEGQDLSSVNDFRENSIRGPQDVSLDDYTLEVYQNTSSYFAFHYINVDVLPKHIWEDVGAGWQDYDPVADGKCIGTGPWKFVEYVPGEYVTMVANEDYYNFPTIRKQALEIAALEEQLASAALASEEAAEDIAALSVQVSALESSTRSLMEASAEDIESLTGEVSSLLSEISGLETDVTSLKSGLSSASNIGYASIAIAILVGAVAIFMSRREAKLQNPILFFFIFI